MRIRNKILLFTLMLLTSSHLFSPSTQAAEGNRQDTNLEVVIHRLVVPSESIIIDNGGKPIDVNSFEELTGLNDVEFSIYDITNQLDKELAEGRTIEEAQIALIQTPFDLDTVQPVHSVTTSRIDGEDGVASFSLRTELDTKQAFLIKETSSPENVTVKADQMVLITPVYSQHGDIMSSVHLYPKNISKHTTEEPPVPNPNLEVPKTSGLPRTNGIEKTTFFPKTGEILQSGFFQLGLILIVCSIGGIVLYRKKEKKTL